MVENKLFKLIFYPKNLAYRPEDWVSINQALKNIGFVGQGIQASDGHFFAGDNFLQLIIFLGCSPNIQLESDGISDNFCRIVMNELREDIRFEYLARDVVAKCPKCKKRLDQWSKSLKEWQNLQHEVFLTCEHCSQKNSIFEFNWRRSAAFARCFIEVWHIYPQEAIPSEEILSTLSAISGEEWDYCYADSSLKAKLD